MKTKPHNSNGLTRRSPGRFLYSSTFSLLVALLGFGCSPGAKVSGDTKPAPGPAAAVDPVGVYTLVTVDGKSLPCTLEHEGHTMTISSGSFVISADGSCSSQISLAGHSTPIEVKASYTREGSDLRMQWQNAGITLGTVAGNTFTMTNEGMVLAYRK